MKKLTKSNLKVKNLVRRKVDLQTLAPKKQNRQQLEEEDLPPLPTIVNNNNTLSDIYLRFIQFSNLFRERICEECNYSVPTFYRKVRGAEKDFSNAERAMITKVEKECIRKMMGAAGMDVADSPGEAA